MKYLIAVIVLAAIVGGGWFYLNSDMNPAYQAPVTTNTDTVNTDTSTDTYADTNPPTNTNTPVATPAAAPASGAGSTGSTQTGATTNTNTTTQTPPVNTATQGSAAATTPPPVQTPPVAPSPVSVAISNFAFSPAQMTVKAGTKVTWTNQDGAPHTVTSDNAAFTSSGTLNNGGSYSFTFTTPGTYSYHCAVHPSMKATIVVTQ